jgi:hypothetical protein
LRNFWVTDLNVTPTNLDYLLCDQSRDWVISVFHRESAQGQLVRRREHTGSPQLEPLVPQHSINGHDSPRLDLAISGVGPL